MIQTLSKSRTDAILKKMVRKIVRGFDPERIFLFGSRARGDARRDSDFDLLIVMPFERKHETAVEIMRALDDMDVAVDVLISKPENFAWRKDQVGTIEWPATHEGIELYAKG